MSQTEATRQSDFITPPRAGQLAALAVTTTAANQDLRLIGNQTGNMSGSNTSIPVGLPGHYATFEADGGDVYVIFGASSASVSAGNVPVATTTGVNVAGVCFRIPSGQALNVKLEVGVDNFIAYVTASGTATLRIAQSSI